MKNFVYMIQPTKLFQTLLAESVLLLEFVDVLAVVLFGSANLYAYLRTFDFKCFKHKSKL